MASGMHRYVAGRANAGNNQQATSQPASVAGLADLKVQVPRQKRFPINGTASRSRMAPNPSHQPADQQTSNTGRPFYDPPSYPDENEENMDLDGDVFHGVQSARDRQDDLHQGNQFGRSRDVYQDRNRPGLGRMNPPLFNYQEGLLNDRATMRMQNFDSWREQNPEGNMAQYLEGDSYPSTTSGQPSAQGELETDHEQYPQIQDLNNMPHPYSRQAEVPQPMVDQPGTESAVQSPTGDLAQEHGVKLLARANPPEAASAAFVFSAPHKSTAQSDVTIRGGNRDTATRPKMGLPTSTPHASKRLAGIAKSSDRRIQADRTGERLPATGNGEIDQGQRLLKREHDNASEEDSSIFTVDTSPTSSQRQESANQQQLHISHSTETADKERVRLDIEPPELFEMDYHALKAKPFDQDPKIASFCTSTDQPGQSLEAKLEATSSLSRHEQELFFASLGIDDWEEAGDWFITRFSGILDKFRAIRRDRRKAARQFEDEVEQRHLAVSKKRKQIDDAMDEMKQSGIKVLQSTPKRSKP